MGRERRAGTSEEGVGEARAVGADHRRGRREEQHLPDSPAITPGGRQRGSSFDTTCIQGGDDLLMERQSGGVEGFDPVGG